MFFSYTCYFVYKILVYRKRQKKKKLFLTRKRVNIFFLFLFDWLKIVEIRVITIFNPLFYSINIIQPDPPLMQTIKEENSIMIWSMY